MTEVRLYRPRMSVLWWVRKPTYFLIVMRWILTGSSNV